jgi:3-oxoadipate enol-lactonase
MRLKPSTRVRACQAPSPIHLRKRQQSVTNLRPQQTTRLREPHPACAGRHRSPDRCRVVVASDTSWAAPAQAVEVWQARIALALEKGMQALAEPTFTRWTCKGFAQRRPEAAAQVRNMISHTSVDGFVACATALQRYDIRHDCENLGCPVLYIVGTEDGGLPQTMRDMQRSTPGSHFIEVPDAGHLPNIEQPEPFNAAVGRFLAHA